MQALNTNIVWKMFPFIDFKLRSDCTYASAQIRYLRVKRDKDDVHAVLLLRVDERERAYMYGTGVYYVYILRQKIQYGVAKAYVADCLEIYNMKYICNENSRNK